MDEILNNDVRPPDTATTGTPARDAMPGRPGSTPVMVAHQPIFDTAGHIFGFELLYRNACWPPGNCPPFSGAVATSSVIIDGLPLIMDSLGDARMLFVNFDESLLLSGLANMLDPARTCIEVLETTSASPGVMAQLSALKQRGFTIALDDYAGPGPADALLPLADYVKVEVLHRPRADVARDVERVLAVGARVVAEKIEDRATLEYCRKLGCHLFQGYFMARPQLASGCTVSTTQALRLKTIKIFSSGSTTTPRLIEAIRADVSLSYRLLRYLNSAHFSFTARVSSVEFAARLMGETGLRRWLCAALLSGIAKGPFVPELIRMSVFRGIFAEALRNSTTGGPPPDRLYLAGLFSLLDAILGMPMEAVLADIRLSSDIDEALIERRGALAHWLHVVESYERGDFGDAARGFAELGLDMSLLTHRYLQALNVSQCICTTQ